MKIKIIYMDRQFLKFPVGRFKWLTKYEIDGLTVNKI